MKPGSVGSGSSEATHDEHKLSENCRTREHGSNTGGQPNKPDSDQQLITGKCRRMSPVSVSTRVRERIRKGAGLHCLGARVMP